MSLPSNLVLEPEPEPRRQPPYGFAKRHGVLLGEEHDGVVLVQCRERTNPTAIVELRRFLGCPVRVEVIPAPHFDELLAKAYDRPSSGAMAMMEDLGEDLDLSQVAESLPELEEPIARTGAREGEAGVGAALRSGLRDEVPDRDRR